ncbi:related to 5`-nucleotidase precursor [Cephalotrichum gorgonifer]|uniref:Related to 5`-nucleotidase n=1 Tax=Cephalotrichum gorgonifer TaxID=2041049 RepID=A0AAE8MRK1_9PEZI|nr:related to 5`-nucleotidase precursor [Cephalotrichum gorgonifer]
MRCNLVLSALACAGLVASEDVLYSSRLMKRGIDAQGNFNMSFFHVNDVHAHLDEFSSSGTDCKSPEKGCYGGYARIKHTIDELRPQYEDSLWLNAGDEFQGTLFYSFYKGEKIAEVLNELEFDAMTLGNHEWDGGDEELGQFLLNLTFPIVSANIISSYEGLNKTIKPYVIFEKQQIALIGCTTPTTVSISNVGDGTQILDPIEEVQKTIDHIKSTTNITRIVALTHIGYVEDQELAAKTTGLSLIMGGHSHTLLGDMKGAEGKYPTIVKNKDGDEVFVVTAYRWGEYVGYIDVTFDDDGKVLAYHGAPIHLVNTTAVDEELQAKIDEWRGPFEAFAAEVVGETKDVLDQETCQKQECTLGNAMSDAMLDFRLKNAKDDKPDFALVNAGGIRATIDAGEITRGEVLTSFPFGNTIVQLEYSGEDLWKILEGAVSKVNQFNNKPITTWFQVSKNIKIEYNPNNEVGSKLVKVTIGGEPLDKKAKYRFVTLDFLAGGGDNILIEVPDYVSLDTQDEVLIWYLQENSPISASVEGRIAIVDGTAEEDAGEGESEGEGKGDNGNSAVAKAVSSWGAALAIAAALAFHL